MVPGTIGTPASIAIFRADILPPRPSIASGGGPINTIPISGPYAARKGLSYAAFREVGVQPAVLAKAGIKRGA